MKDLAQFFSYMNHTSFSYVVLRNWENLPYHVETGAHSDLDILVYDLDHFLELFPHLERVYPAPRVQFKLFLDSGEFVQLDARYVGDGYYPDHFEQAILDTREWNENGFFTPNPIHHRLGLVYHCVHHKGHNNYPNFLGNLTVPQMLDSLKQNKMLSWIEPEDPSVGRFNKYVRGGTALINTKDGAVEKKQYRHLAYNLIDNEERILDKLDSKHFPKLLGRDGNTLRIEHCGEALSAENLPEDWKEQLVHICDLLDTYSIVHRDVRLDNLMVKGETIMLLDFGWARYSDESDGKHPDLLGYPNKCPLGFNDRYSMNRVIKQLDCERERNYEKM